MKAFQRRGQPVISVDTKKKELVGDFRNVGREWRPRGQPQEVRTHDFQDDDLGKVIPYGVYDLTHNEAWVSVGIDHDTAEFAVASIRRWWRTMGTKRFPRAARLLITADSGGSNGARSRLWKVALQRFHERAVAAEGTNPGSNREQGPRPLACRHFVGLGTRFSSSRHLVSRSPSHNATWQADII